MKYIFDRYSLLDVLFPFLFILSLFLMLYLHTYTHSCVWKEYRTLFLPLKHGNITEVMEKENIKGFISSQSVDERFQNIEEATYPFTLRELYSQWFENEQENLAYIYIPKKSYIPFTFLKTLHDEGIPFYLEGEPHLHYINLICISFLFIFFLIFSNKKSLFFFASLPFLLLSFLISSFLMFYAIAIFLLSILHIIEIFFAPSHLTKEQRKNKIKKNTLIFIIPLFALGLVFFDNYLSYIYVFLSLIASFSIGYVIEKFNYLFEKAKDAKRAHERFKPPAIHPDFIELIWNKSKAILILILFCLSFTPHIAFHLFYSNPLPENYTNTLYFPMPSTINKHQDFSFSSYTECLENKAGDALPDLTNYILDTWFYNVFQYLDVSEPITFPEEDEQVIFRDFYNEGNGVIKEKEPLIFTFNNTFLKKTLDSIPKRSIEGMLQKEDGFVSAFYNFKFFPITRYDILTIAFSLLFIFISWIIILLKVSY
ncbi:MAG: hypothetical protein ACTTKH_04195 [Treponema sp.]